MNPEEIRGLETESENNRRRNEVIEMHLFDEDASEEKTLCGADVPAVYLKGVRGYLSERLNEIWGGATCEGCKVSTPRFAIMLAQKLEDDGLLEEAEEYRQLADMLQRETAQQPSGR